MNLRIFLFLVLIPGLLVAQVISTSPPQPKISPLFSRVIRSQHPNAQIAFSEPNEAYQWVEFRSADGYQKARFNLTTGLWMRANLNPDEVSKLYFDAIEVERLKRNYQYEK